MNNAEAISPVTSRTRQPRLGTAWVAMCMALALHVLDEALTGFLDVYNPTVRALRARLGWFPMPTFTFSEWLAGLVLVVALLLAVSPFVFRGDRWPRPLAYVFAVIMFLNAVSHTVGTLRGHTVATVTFAPVMPGFYSSGLLLIGSVWLLVRLRRTA